MATTAREHEATASWLRDRGAETPSLAIEKAPQLNASLDRFADSVGDAIADICGEGASGVADRVATTTTFELLGAYVGYPAVTLRSAALQSRAVLICDESIVDALLNAMLGVDPVQEAKMEAAPRERSELEMQIVLGFARALAAGIADAFAPVANFDLQVEAVHAITDVNLLGPREMPAIMAQYTIKTRGGAFRIVLGLPQSFTVPLAEMFTQGPDPTAVAVDPHWARGMEDGVARAKLSLTAVLDDFQMSLGDVAGLAVGSLLPLSHGGDGHVRIECVERGVFLCRLGERGQRYALEIEDIIANNPDDEYYVAP